MFETALILLYLTAVVKTKEEGVYFKVRENHFLFDEKTVWDQKVDSLLSCSQICGRRNDCKFVNFKKDEGICSISDRQSSGKVVQRKGYFYLKKVQLSERPKPLGTTRQVAVSSCQILRSQSPIPPSGIYWINPKGESQANAFKSYCDMETDGGGWTLVWSYTFTNYSGFTGKSNAITPRPSWSVNSKVDVPISTTPPLNETDFNAVSFSEWKQLGSRVLIKSNINNWLVCEPGTGSLVLWQDGSMSCQIVKRVTDTCNSTPAPTKFASSKRYGPMFYSTGDWWTSAYYYFDGYRGDNWPTHDPCGKNQGNHLKNVADPHGNIFIR